MRIQYFINWAQADWEFLYNDSTLYMFGVLIYMPSAWLITDAVKLEHTAVMTFARFLHYKVTFFFPPPFHTIVLLLILWKQDTKFSPYSNSRNEELRSWASLSWREKYLYKLSRILLYRRFLTSSPFSHFIRSVWTQRIFIWYYEL